MLLTGVYNRSLDQKLRVAIPRKLRQALTPETGKGVYLAPGTDGSLAIYAEAAFSALADRLAQASPTREDVRAFNRLFYARAQWAEPDSQGRIRIPPELVALARLEKEVMLLGVHDHLELWAAEQWQTYLADKQGQYDQIAEAAFR